MGKQPTVAWSYLLPLDSAGKDPLYMQLYHALRRAILSGQLRAGTRLPSTRVLASEMAISRTTVLSAYDQLLAEGYLEARTGSGTFVTLNLPETLPEVQTHREISPRSVIAPRLTRSCQRVLQSPLVPRHKTSLAKAFQPGLPALDAFPFDIWSRLAEKHYRQPSFELLAYGDPAGYWPLRAAISEYITATRAVRCEPSQVLIVSGAQQAIDITIRTLLSQDDAVWFEDPGYPRAQGAFWAAGVRVVPVPVDRDGLSVALGRQRCERARLAYVTPSHQYPLGIVMSLARRLELLEWAQQAGAWILEDDYDSEFRYRGRPLASLQGLDTHGSVIYMGTFSKVLFPSLRLGYLILPPALVEPFSVMRALESRHSPTIEQAILTDFIREGYFSRHIRKMRTLYAHRQRFLIDCVRREAGNLLELTDHEAGMHCIGWLPSTIDDLAVAQMAAQQGLSLQALSECRISSTGRPGLLLGYAGASEEELRDGVRKLISVLTSYRMACLDTNII